jgi:hypothetical protein
LRLTAPPAAPARCGIRRTSATWLDQPHGEAEAREACARVVAMLRHPLDLQLIDWLLELVRTSGGA